MSRINARKQIKKEKLDTMINYVENDHLCRTSMILEYFDELNFEDCGHCDRCLEKKRKTTRTDQARVEEMVLYELKKGPRLPEELTKIFDDHEMLMVEDLIRDMNDRGDLRYDTMGRLVWMK
jgi:ATP-dependent DNA helicase RecQ